MEGWAHELLYQVWRPIVQLEAPALRKTQG